MGLEVGGRLGVRARVGARVRVRVSFLAPH